MTDDQRPDLEWPSEDLAASRKPEPRPDVAWPSEDVAKAAQASPSQPQPAPQPPTPQPPAPEPKPEPPAPEPTPQPPAPEPKPEPPAPEPTPQPPAPERRPEPPTPEPTSQPPTPEPTSQPSELEPAAAFVPPPIQQPPFASPPDVLPRPEVPVYQPPTEPYGVPSQPTEPYGVPPSAAEEPAWMPPPEYQQLPGENPYAQHAAEDRSAIGGPPVYGGPPAYGGPPGYGQQDPGQQDYGNPYATSQYQNQYTAPSETFEPGPYAGAGTPPPQDATTEETVEEGKSYFRKDIEGLRAVAVLAVLLFHVGLPLFEGGFVGVDVFYVISGFLITGLLLREGEQTGKVDLVRFYARRMRRLLPAALLVIVVTLVLSAFIVSPLRLTDIAADAAASAFYVANFRFALEATDYLATAAPSPLLHMWSLGVEEQFYLFWPLILLLFVRFLPGRLVGIVLLLLTVASFAVSFVWTSSMPEWAFFSPVTRAWELAAGALIAVGLLRIPARVPRIAGSIAVITGLVLIAVSVLMSGLLAELGMAGNDISNALFASPTSPFPGVAALLPVAGAVLVILGGSHSRTLIGRFVLGNPISRYFGRISYSLYLWHWPILILIPIELGVDDLSTRLLLAGVSILLAILSTELWERPWRRSGALEKRSGGTVRLGLAGSVAVGVTALLMSGTIALPSNIELPGIQPPREVVALAGVKEDLPAYYDDCHLLGYGRQKLLTDCVYGDPDGEHTAVLVGDSHAAQWWPALEAYARDKGWRLEVYTKAACAVIDVPVWERAQRSVFDACINWRGKVLDHIREIQPDTVYVGLSRDYELWNGSVIQSSDATAYWREKLTEYLATLGGPASEVVLLAETPFLRYDPVDCLADEDIRNCDPPRRSAVDADYAELERRAADDAGAELLSINDILCDEATCPVVADDVVVFRDNHHLTATYMQQLAEPIGNLLEGRPAYPTPVPTLPPASPEANGA